MGYNLPHPRDIAAAFLGSLSIVYGARDPFAKEVARDCTEAAARMIAKLSDRDAGKYAREALSALDDAEVREIAEALSADARLDIVLGETAPARRMLIGYAKWRDARDRCLVLLDECARRGDREADKLADDLRESEFFILDAFLNCDAEVEA